MCSRSRNHDNGIYCLVMKFGMKRCCGTHPFPADADQPAFRFCISVTCDDVEFWIVTEPLHMHCIPAIIKIDTMFPCRCGLYANINQPLLADIFILCSCYSIPYDPYLVCR